MPLFLHNVNMKMRLMIKEGIYKILYNIILLGGLELTSKNINIFSFIYINCSITSVYRLCLIKCLIHLAIILVCIHIISYTQINNP